MALGSIVAASALAVSLAPPGAMPDASGLAAVANFCGPKQAFGIAYGSRGKPGIHMSFVSSLLPLPAAYRPFDTAEVVVTLIGRRRHTVHAQADFDSELRAEHALATVRAALIAEGWIVGPAVDGRPSNSLYSGTQALDPKRPTGRIAELFILGTRLYFGCSDAAWKRQADREMPARPAPPGSAQPPSPALQTAGGR